MHFSLIMIFLSIISSPISPFSPLPQSVFSTFYSFIRLFANKRIEYEVSSNKVLFLFVNTNKGASIRLFDYSQLKTKQEERPIKARHYAFSRVMASVELALNK